MSSTHAKLISEGLIHNRTNYKTGFYASTKTGVSEFYASSYELLRMQLLDADESVSTWTKKHGIRLAYEIDSKPHNYVPDFKITRIDGSITIEEVKGRECSMSKLKQSLLAEFCQKQNWNTSYLNYASLHALMIKQ